MAGDEGLAELFRGDLEGLGATEARMFGTRCFLLHGHMVCGVHKGGAMVRVGAPNAAAALALPGVRQVAHSGRRMTGFVDLDGDAMADDTIRGAILGLALDYVRGLPPK